MFSSAMFPPSRRDSLPTLSEIARYISGSAEPPYHALNLMPLYFAGLWLAVMTMPPRTLRCRAVKEIVCEGVGRLLLRRGRRQRCGVIQRFVARACICFVHGRLGRRFGSGGCRFRLFDAAAGDAAVVIGARRAKLGRDIRHHEGDDNDENEAREV